LRRIVIDAAPIRNCDVGFVTPKCACGAPPAHHRKFIAGASRHRLEPVEWGLS